MTCEQARYHEFESPEALQHLETCPDCQDWQNDTSVLRELRDVHVPSGPLRQRVLPVKTRPNRWPKFAAIAASLVLLSGALWQLRQQPAVANPPMPHVAASPPPAPPAAEIPPPARSPRVRYRAATARERLPQTPKLEPLYMKLETADPDVVIYWSVEGGLE